MRTGPPGSPGAGSVHGGPIRGWSRKVPGPVASTRPSALAGPVLGTENALFSVVDKARASPRKALLNVGCPSSCTPLWGVRPDAKT